jgi:hypothetical protein
MDNSPARLGKIISYEGRVRIRLRMAAHASEAY